MEKDRLRCISGKSEPFLINFVAVLWMDLMPLSVIFVATFWP